MKQVNGNDDYVLVTGGSAGLGAAIAKQFASRGYNLILTARRKDRLESLATSFEEDYDIKACVIVCDLSLPEAAQSLFDQTNALNLHVSGLVNNAGYGIIGKFHKQGNLERYNHMVELMVMSCVRLSYLYGAKMVERGYGWIINVSSLSAFMPASEGAPLYSPVKKFLLDFSQAHGEELKNTGVHVTALCPGFTKTEFHLIDKEIEAAAKGIPAYMWMDVDLIASQGVDAVMRGDSFYINGKINRFLALLRKILPDRVGRWIIKSKKAEVING